MNQEQSRDIKEAARRSGADLVGIVRVADLPEHREEMESMLPGAKSVVVVAARHSLAALRSPKLQMGQFDTMYTYQQAGWTAQALARHLEALGFPSLAVPAFLPLDMQAPKKGMRGEICWRRAGVRSGLGSYGENGLLVTREYGAAVRLSGVLTRAELVPDAPLKEDACDHCGRCLAACPSGALSGQGKINKKLCGDQIFQFGLRAYRDFLEGLVTLPREEAVKTIQGFELRELWQTFMTGNYYYCFACQAQCSATLLP
ncbi:MAG: 4Fe-4S binding protein [Deltaproteobacteria bacterium]|nr:4Fe-4S binding protein [Deltaproteobacteria bacterium]